MKNLSIIALLLFLASCSQDRYKISGTLAGDTIPSKVYLKLVDGVNEPKVVDSSDVKNGAFSFSGKAPHQEYAVIQLSNDIYFPVILEKGEISFNAELENLSQYELKGTEGNRALSEFRRVDKYFKYGLDSIYQSYISAQTSGQITASLDSSIKKSYDNFSKKRQSFVERFIKDHSNSLASAAILLQEQYNLEDEKVNELFDGLSKELSESGVVITLKKENDIRKATALGQPFVDFKLPDVAGKEQQFSALVNGHKVVLLDFWASWCGPCRRENPNVVDLYSKFKDKGLLIVGVSLDEKKDKWVEAIKADNIIWVQLSDLKGWKSGAAAAYGVKAIPSTFLIHNGLIVAKNLRGDELEGRVADLIK